MNRWAAAIHKVFGGNSAYAIYGAGKFSGHLLRLLRRYGLTLPRCIVDDEPTATELEGIPIVETHAFHHDDHAFIVLGSACHQRAMRQRLQACFGGDLPVLDLEEVAATVTESPHEVQSRERLASLHNAHKGERCFIVGNGPSLTVRDLERLTGEICFAANRIDLAFARTEWRPTYYAVIDEYVATQNEKAIREIKACDKFFPHLLNYIIPPMQDGVYFKYNVMPQFPDTPKFGTDPVGEGFYSGSTVTYLFLQLALYMGFKEVVLIGMDFSFARPGGSDTTGALVTAKEEQNHFHPHYRTPGEIWQYPNLEHQRMAFQMARTAYAERGASVCNASRTTKLDVFERVNFDDILQ